MAHVYPKCQSPAGVEVEMSLSGWSGNLGPIGGVVSLAQRSARKFQVRIKLAAFGAESDITNST